MMARQSQRPNEGTVFSSRLPPFPVAFQRWGRRCGALSITGGIRRGRDGRYGIMSSTCDAEARASLETGQGKTMLQRKHLSYV